MKTRFISGAKCLLLAAAVITNSPVRGQDVTSRQSEPGYVAKQEGLRALLGAISAQLAKPIIVSKGAAAKQVSGEFRLAEPGILSEISRQLGLITYSDGHAIYVYDASETKTVVIALKHVSPSSLQRFLKSSGLVDARYPLRSDGFSTVYLAGPPIYVDLVTQAAESMDREAAISTDQHVEIIRLHNTFVTDRTYTRRDEGVVIPGIATVIQRLLNTSLTNPSENQHARILPPSNTGRGEKPVPLLDDPIPRPLPAADPATQDLALTRVRIIAYPDTNSLLVKGTVEQVSLVRRIVEGLDQEKRHVELALWIIDLEKDDLDQLGVNWQGAAKLGNAFGATFNADGIASFTTVGGAEFMASVVALARDNRAQIVSRPVVLTQENTPAMFDNSHTFYTQLIGERAVELQQVTYGTMVNVLPRFTFKSDIELSVNIEDGSATPVEDVDASETRPLPSVSRTRVSTVARVPRGKSLLVGGYARGETGDTTSKIPLLGDLPFVGGIFRYKQSRNKNTVRIFLIRPREIVDSMDLPLPNLQEQTDFNEVIRRLGDTSGAAPTHGEAKDGD